MGDEGGEGVGEGVWVNACRNGLDSSLVSCSIVS